MPREYWREATQGGARDGLNTVSTYVFWNMHEPKPGVFDFTGNRDLSTFIRMAQEVDESVPGVVEQMLVKVTEQGGGVLGLMLMKVRTLWC